MRTTVVPAQITTVEDKIAGNLSFIQLLLLIFPVFLSGLIFSLMPPLMEINGLKIMITLLSLSGAAILASRVKGVITLYRLIILVRYKARPRIWVYNKNDLYLRPSIHNQGEVIAGEKETINQSHIGNQLEEIDLLKDISLDTQQSSFKLERNFKTKKGVLYVSTK